jgi:1-acyl-sn-glycerol-3-phosphate acyltransferase
LDPFVVLASMPRPVTVLSKIENFSIPFWGWIFKWYGAIPVRRGQVDRRALRGALAALEAETLLIVAPEGTRSPDGALQPALDGMAYLAQRASATIVPLAITGQTAFGHNVKRLRRTPVCIQVGRPFRVQAGGRRLERDVLHAVTTEAMYRLAALLPPAQRGAYADLDQATTRYLHFVEDDPGRDGGPPAGAHRTACAGAPRVPRETVEGG